MIWRRRVIRSSAEAIVKIRMSDDAVREWILLRDGKFDADGVFLCMGVAEKNKFLKNKEKLIKRKTSLNEVFFVDALTRYSAHYSTELEIVSVSC